MLDVALNYDRCRSQLRFRSKYENSISYRGPGGLSSYDDRVISYVGLSMIFDHDRVMMITRSRLKSILRSSQSLGARPQHTR